ncbi:hypothetical protein HMPREF1531_02186 [Propionibacterium sp. oral taxon 192 str. F0372]|nr:hypothetical protein HMPREF1531_02186 [Propionibacterium sp. oral taxon 192 str. F0372]
MGRGRFDDLVSVVENFGWRKELSVERIPAPQRIAPHSVAIEADVIINKNQELGTGRLIILHDPAGNSSWSGTHRCVSFARADVEVEMVTDPLLAEVGWTWLIGSLEHAGADHHDVSGTVTAVSSRCFGDLSGEPDRAEVEIRASWTPEVTEPEDIASHLRAWQNLLCTTTGLPQLPEGVVPLTSRIAR